MNRFFTGGVFVLLLGSAAAGQGASGTVTGELKKWHRITITFDGPATSESAVPNPFRDYRLNVTFTKGTRSLVVPGFYAADGNAAETGASSGSKWRVHFVPDEEGTWSWRASFRAGPDVALSLDPAAGTPASFDGASGSFSVGPTDKAGRDHRAKGMLRYVGAHYLRFAQTGEYFLKGGADSPENFLAYADFDQTTPTHRYDPHAGDWRTGDPTWRGGKGKNIIGALNYLAGKGMNSVYFLTMNVGGDGRDVWPWTSSGERYRFDVSKLDQWEIVFSHMDRLGIQLHVVTQETENDQLLDGGGLGPQRKLYYRELVARFAHHLALVWNLGEENTNTDAQRKEFAGHLRALDPYDHPLVVHTYPGQYDSVYTPLLGFPHFEGPSLQTNSTHAETVKWVQRSAQNGRRWFVCLDEIGPADTGVVPDSYDFGHDGVRKNHLWGNLMGGGAGCEWYFGYAYPHNDLNCEDWRSRDNMWNLTRIALEFFQRYLPFHEMSPSDGLVSSGWCLAKPGSVYAIYLPNGGSATVQLAPGTYSVHWYDPRSGGALQTGSVATLTGGGAVSIGQPPRDAARDWAALVRATGGGAMAVTGFVLVNADTDRDLGPLADGATINLAALPTRNLNVRAETSPPTVGSVRFGYDGNPNFRTENVAPYALAGDTSGNYYPWTPAVGAHALSATPFSGSGATGSAGTSKAITFHVIDQANTPPSVRLTSPADGAAFTAPATITLAAEASDPDGQVVRVDFYRDTTLLGSDSAAPYGFTWSGVGAGTYTLTARAVDDGGAEATSAAVTVTVSSGSSMAVTGFVLVNADTDEDLGPLPNGATIRLSALATRNLNVRANTSPSTVGSVRFSYDGNSNFRTENVAPYALAGDTSGDYYPWTPAVGSHGLGATPYSRSGGGGVAGEPLSITFTVVE